MSKKTNPTIYRLKKYKNWASRSFFEDFNYSSLLYQDLYIQNFLENFITYNISDSFVHNISIQRKKSRIFIFLDYYAFKKNNRKINVRFRPSIFKKKKSLELQRKKYIYKFYSLPLEKNYYFSQQKSKKFLRFSLERSGKHPFFDNLYGSLRLKKKVSYLQVFTLKRLLILNLAFLTGCRVFLYSRNIGFVRKSLLPFYRKSYYVPAWKKKRLKAFSTVKDFDKNFPGLRLTLAAEILSVPKVKKDDAVLKLIKHLKLRFFAPRKLRGMEVPLFIHLIHTSFIFKSPALLGEFISRHIGKNIRFFYLFIFFIRNIVSALFFYSNLKGLKIQIKGRLGRSLRKRTQILKFGAMPLHGMDNLVYYSFNEAITIYGICGIKVWYYY